MPWQPVSVRMAVNKSKVSVGFIVVGVLTALLGIVLVFVGPIVIDDQVVKVRSALALTFSINTAGIFICRWT